MNNNLTSGPIFRSIVKFALPVLLALLLQALYGAVDLLIVGHFGSTADVSGVATGSGILNTINMIISGFAMGVTVLVGRRIGNKEPDKAGDAIGNAICLFGVFALILSIAVPIFAPTFSSWLNAPEEAISQTIGYIRICGYGLIFIIAYNLLGAIFRGIGDSITPFIAVSIACVCNVILDLAFVKSMNMGAQGAALATVIAQAISVILSLLIISRRKLPFKFSLKSIKFGSDIIQELTVGTPVALQEFLVGISFMVIQGVVNSIDLYASAGVGVSSKVTAFIMLVPSAFMQSMSAFVAQNLGAGERKRAKKALFYCIASALAIGVFMFLLSFFKGDFFASLFDDSPEVISAGALYLKAFAIDCMLTPFLFCFLGYFNGCGKTLFVMVQGLIGAFGVRVPLCLFFSKQNWATLFHIGLSTPASTIVQIILCIVVYVLIENKEKKKFNS